MCVANNNKARVCAINTRSLVLLFTHKKNPTFNYTFLVFCIIVLCTLAVVRCLPN